VPKRWRVGIIGCGWAGERHAHVLAKLNERADLCAIADSDLTVAQAKARAWHVPHWTDDYTQLLHPDLLDAVSLCLPHSLHAPAAIAAARAGLHVLVEKPLAATLPEVDAMIAAADAAGTCLLVAETARFNTCTLKAANLLQSGALGDLFLVRIAREHQMHDYLRQRPWFLHDPAGGITYSGGIHDFETVRMLAGEIEHIYALPARKVLPEMTGDDSSVALVGLRSGAVAVLVESFSLRTPQPGVHIAAHGSHGSLWLHRDQIRLYTSNQDGVPEDVRQWSVDPRDPFRAEISHWLDCLDRGLFAASASIIGAREQRKPLLAVLASYASMQQGKRITLAEYERSHSNAQSGGRDEDSER
jgi:predicted dehydrogenase